MTKSEARAIMQRLIQIEVRMNGAFNMVCKEKPYSEEARALWEEHFSGIVKDCTDVLAIASEELDHKM